MELSESMSNGVFQQESTCNSISDISGCLEELERFIPNNRYILGRRNGSRINLAPFLEGGNHCAIGKHRCYGGLAPAEGLNGDSVAGVAGNEGVGCAIGSIAHDPFHDGLDTTSDPECFGVANNVVRGSWLDAGRYS